MAAQEKKVDPQVERGRYITRISGCHDCHTPGYAPSGGKAPQCQYLVGVMLGWRGPWDPQPRTGG